MKTKLTKISMLLMAFAFCIQLQAQTQSPRKALSFNGSTQYVSGTTGISTALTAITIEAWVNHNTLPAGAIQRYVTIQPEVAVLRYDGSGLGGTNELHFYIKNTSGAIVSLRVDNVLSTGTWMHIAGTYDGTIMKLYLNGNLISSASPAGGLYAPTGAFSFSANGAEAFDGKMDEVSVWNYVRAIYEIREDMYRTAPIANLGLKNYWQFNNGSGTTLTDMKGSATGTLNNMTNTNWIASTIPFAAGAVNTQTVSTTGTKTFTGTGLIMNFTAKNGVDEIVASRIDTLPNTSPTGVSTVFNSQYWVVKRFGSGTSFTENLTFTLSEDLISADESSPSTILLYARPDNSDASWTLLTSATSVNAANNTATFNGITGLSQFIVVRNCTPPTISSQSTAGQTQPLNGTFTAITVTGTGANLIYQWYSNTTASNIGGTSLGSNNGAQTNSYTPQATTVGKLYYYCVVSSICGTAPTSAVSGEFIVNPIATAPAGSGTAGDPYQIANVYNLYWLSINTTYWNMNYIQTADIDASQTTSWNSGSGFSPIGNVSTEFQGTYDGQNHTITNLYINRSSTDYVGLFGYITGSGSEVKNLGLINVNITGRDRVAGLVGISNGGGITISNCYSTGNVNGNNTVGGLVGIVSSTGTILNCYSTGNVTGRGTVGGLVGYNGGTISKCHATGSVTGSGSSNYYGGLVGANEAQEVNQSFATGSVSGDAYVGGLFGLNTSSVNNCYATGSVNGSEGNIGGLTGTNEDNGMLTNCYSTGSVTGSWSTVGGLIGYNGPFNQVNNCFWDTQTSGKSSSPGGGTGLTTAQMKTQSPFTTTPSNWDFTAGSGIWKIESCANISYPYLQAFTYDTPGASPAVNPIPGLVMITPVTAISSQSTAGQTQTLNGTFTPITVTATGTNLMYQWYKNATASNSGGTSLGTNNGAQTNSYTPQASTVGTLYYYCVVTGDCGTPQTTAVSGAFHVNPIAIAPAGSGTADDPYRIANLNNLYYLSTTPGLWDQGYTFIQTANINAAETRNWDGEQGFTPIGNESVMFEGNYHGKGNSIDSLYINRPGSSEVAFFGYIHQTPSGGNSTIDSLSLTNVNITGHYNVGGLGGGASYFNISHCSVIGGSVTATNSQYSAGVGGMFGSTSGYTANNNSTSHCFAAVAVSGQGEVGGFVGQTYGGYINQCYSAGSVSGTGEYVGGFVGYRMSLGVPYSLDSSYYDIQASGQATGAGRNDQPAYNHLQGKTTAEMKTQATYDGWNFSTVWKISGSVNNGYPYFDYPTQISTVGVSNIANNTATATGSINHIGTLAITAHGFCWNTTGTPTLADGKINLGATTTSGDYSASINSFNHNTTYYLRAYLIDAQDTIYGNVVNFTTTNVPVGVTCVGLPTSTNTSRIRVPDNNTLDLTNNYSMEVWINPANQSVTSGDRCLIWKGEKSLGTPSMSSYSLGRLPTGNLLGLTFDGMSTADNILVPNTWNHIAAVNDNGTRHIYVNGVEYPLTGTPRTITANTLPLIIGCGIKAGSWYSYYGKYDEMSLWNTVLSQSQIREHMHFPLSGSETGLVSYWQFNEGSGTSISDKMGINNGTLVINGDGDDGYVIVPNPANYWHGSTIPFGLGYSNTQVVTATGTNTFTNAGLAMNFTAKTGMDSIVVARIDTFPNINPTGLTTVFDRQYWAVHKYGTGTLTANLTFTISEGFTAEDQSVPSKIKLYKRSSMADDSTWVYVASASTVNATTKQATFNGISDFSQFIIARGACVVYIPDANFRAALIANASINTNGDNEIQCAEATAFTGTIDVTSANIADMTGIEAFTNITELYCANNLLTTLNVSNNTALTYLYCNGNQLTSLDVSTNTALLYLLCDHNQLTSLNVSTIATLKQLHCNNNALSNLDVSLNTALLALNCQYNSLTSLNVKNGHNTSLQTFVASNNSGLSCIQVDDAIYSASHWMSKDAGASYSETCNCIWTGATDTDWNTSNNWAASAKPSSINDVTIPIVTNQPVVSASAACKNLTLQPKATLRLSSATLAVGGNLALQSDNTGTATLVDNGTLTVSGTTNMQQYLTGAGAETPNGRFWYMANPVIGATSSTFDAVGSNKMWYYSEPAHAYTEITDNTTELTVGTGYAVRLGANNTVTFTGTGFYNGDKIFNLSRANDTNEKRGYNLIGNPYPSYLDWQQITLPASVMTTIWTRSCSSGGAMGFDTYNSSLAEGARGVSSVGHTVTQYIAPLQAFWVKVAAGYTTANITVNNSLRSLTDVAAPSNNLKAPAIQTQKVLRLQVSNDTNSDETVIAFNANASNGFDTYDSPKMTNDNEAIPELYTLTGDEKLAINGMNNYTLNQEMPLGFTTGTSGNFTIKATDIRNFDTKTKIILKDSELNSEQELTAQTTYPFSSGVIDNANRFSIIFRTVDVPTDVLKNANQILFVYKNANNQITIHRNSSQTANITVCNSIGQRLISTSANGTIIVIKKEFSPGVYFVTVNFDGNKTTKKVIIN